MSPGASVAYVGLGSNQAGPHRQVRRALEWLGDLEATRLAACSGLYETEPWGRVDQPPFVNAVARLDTGLDPHALLEALQTLELRAGRVRAGSNQAGGGDRDSRWGPRCLDLDILLFDELVIDSEVLAIPHPYLHRREFVLAPLFELAPALEVPGRASVAALREAVRGQGVRRLEDVDGA